MAEEHRTSLDSDDLQESIERREGKLQQELDNLFSGNAGAIAALEAFRKHNLNKKVTS